MRRDDHAPVSRVLQPPAAAIAAQLSGIPRPAMSNVRAIGQDDVDGSLEEFVQTLHHATTQPTAGNAIGSSNGTTSRSGLDDPDERPEIENERPDGRTVVFLVIGVRSVPSYSTADNTPTRGGESWLVYVMGTNLEDYPAFAILNFFTYVRILLSVG